MKKKITEITIPFAGMVMVMNRYNIMSPKLHAIIILSFSKDLVSSYIMKRPFVYPIRNLGTNASVRTPSTT